MSLKLKLRREIKNDGHRCSIRIAGRQHFFPEMNASRCSPIIGVRFLTPNNLPLVDGPFRRNVDCI